MHPDETYLNLLDDCLTNGDRREGRNGGTRSLFGRQIRFNLADGFPLLTTKRVFFKAIVVELLWFLRGDTNIEYLHDYGVTIWDEWADAEGNLGPVYGKQWRDWFDRFCSQGIDQITQVINSLKTDPYGRRHIVTAWNPADIPDMALPPCHCLFQFYVSQGRLSCHLYQRSADIFLGVPFNIASYALLTHIIAREVGLDVGELVISFGDVHLYENHVEAATEQLTRAPRHVPDLMMPSIWPGIDSLVPQGFGLIGYDPWPAIRAEVSA